jgi:hypothetical protein
MQARPTLRDGVEIPAGFPCRTAVKLLDSAQIKSIQRGIPPAGLFFDTHNIRIPEEITHGYP